MHGAEPVGPRVAERALVELVEERLVGIDLAVLVGQLDRRAVEDKVADDLVELAPGHVGRVHARLRRAAGARRRFVQVEVVRAVVLVVEEEAIVAATLLCAAVRVQVGDAARVLLEEVLVAVGVRVAARRWRWRWRWRLACFWLLGPLGAQ